MRAKLRYVPLVILAVCLFAALIRLERFDMGFITGACMTVGALGIAGFLR